MVPFFPELLPDEHIFSAIGRYHRISGNRSIDHTRSLLRMPAGPLKPQDVFNAPYYKSLEAVSTLVQKPPTTTANLHTLSAFFRITIPPSLRQKQLGHWRRDEPGVPASHQAMNDRMLTFDKSWRLCTECVLSDEHQFGIPYWHVTHQIPSVTSCTVHQTQLVRTGLKTLNNLELPGDLCCDHDRGLISNQNCSWDTWLTELFSKLQKQDATTDLEQLKRVVSRIWDIPSHPKQAQNSRFQQVLEQVEQTVGKQFLSSLFEFYQGEGTTYRGRRRPNFIRTSLCHDSSKLRHPIYYLVPLWAAVLSPTISDFQLDNQLI